jgi:DNA-binding MurR/RpiR family transcriptional regulator
VEATIRSVPKDATHWSVRCMAASQKVSPATVLRIWKKHKLQPHRVESFKFSNYPEFVPKIHRPVHPGSIRWSVGSPKSRAREPAAAHFTPFAN